MELRSSNCKLNPLPPDPFRHQDSAIARRCDFPCRSFKRGHQYSIRLPQRHGPLRSVYNTINPPADLGRGQILWHYSEYSSAIRERANCASRPSHSN